MTVNLKQALWSQSNSLGVTGGKGIGPEVCEAKHRFSLARLLHVYG